MSWKNICKSKLSLNLSLAGLFCSFLLSAPLSMADDEPTLSGSGDNEQPGATFIINQPKPYTRAQEYIQPSSSMSTLSGNPFTSGGWGSPYYGNGYLGGAGVVPGFAPLIGAPIYGGGYFNGGAGPWSSGWVNHGYGRYGAGLSPFSTGYGPSVFASGSGGYGSGFPGFGSGYAGWDNGFSGFNRGYSGWGNGFGGYPGYGPVAPGFGYGYGGGFGGFGGLGGFGGGSDLGLTEPSQVVQTEPSKSSGNYYAPSTVDSTASGSYYAQTDSNSVQMPVKRSPSTSNYWKQDSNSNYWGSGGGSGTPFGKDLNSVPWNR